MFDLASNIIPKKSITALDRTATVTGSIVDLKDYKAASVMVCIGAVAIADASNYFTFTIEVGDDSGLSDAAEVSSYEVSKLAAGTTWDRKVNATGEADDVALVGFNAGGKRYARVKATETGTAQATFGAYFVLGEALTKPAVA